MAFIGLGSFYPLAQQAAAEYEKRTGVRPTVINPYYITGLDKELLAQLGKTHKTVVTLEDGVLDGGFGQKSQPTTAKQTPRCCATACKRIP